MFDLITGKSEHLPRHSAMPIVISMSLQSVLIAAAVIVPLLFVVEKVPAVPTMLAFVAAPPAPPPPPPPPPPPASSKPASAPKPVPTTGANAAPITPPARIEPEIADDEGFDGVPGGVEGGLPGGILGGVVGGIEDVPPPPPPAPPPPARRDPVRVGGQIKEPRLVHRVEPIYPSLAVHARITGTVILEAIVDKEGTVTDVTVLRSANGLLDRAAVDAVRQWRYLPLVLNGIPERFVLTVALRFDLVDPKE